MKIARELLEILACPRCKGAVQADTEHDCLVCENCKLAYPVRDNIPVMLIDEAQPLSDSSEHPSA